MKRVELYGRVRHAVMIEGLSQREAARCFGIDPRTVRKMLSYSAPPGYVRTRPPVRPKLDPFIGIIDRILEEDKDRPKKQRHTSKRIFERLRDEYGFTGKITIVKDYICGVRQRRREMFVPLTHPPGHAQVDFGEALAVIGGVERKIHFLAMSLPHSDACFVKAYPGETTEAFCDGHVSGFSFFGGVPRSILYDNTTIAVARILGDGKRQRTRVFSELRSHYLFEDRFGRPGKGNDKGKVEGIVGYCRRNFLAPMPRFRNFDDLNTHLEACCAKRWAEQLRGHDQTVGERLERDRAVLQRLPAIAYDACDKRPGRVSSLSLVRYRGTDYSVPTRFGHCEVLVRGYVHEVVISCAAEVIARHPRSYEQEDFVFDPLHYLSLLEQKTNALDQAAPLTELLFEQIAALSQKIAGLEKEIRSRTRAREEMKRLMTIPGIGPICAMAVSAFAPPMESFGCGRDFAAWVGLTPRQHSTAGKQRLGRITKMGQRDLRQLLVLGATSVLRHMRKREELDDPWLRRMIAEKPPKLVAVALANKMAPIIWALSVKKECYRAPVATAAAGE